jgi:hypothetical protein
MPQQSAPRSQHDHDGTTFDGASAICLTPSLLGVIGVWCEAFIAIDPSVYAPRCPQPEPPQSEHSVYGHKRERLPRSRTHLALIPRVSRRVFRSVEMACPPRSLARFGRLDRSRSRAQGHRDSMPAEDPDKGQGPRRIAGRAVALPCEHRGTRSIECRGSLPSPLRSASVRVRDR